VKPGGVATGAEGTEDFPLPCRRVFQDRKHLIAVAGEDELIENQRFFTGNPHFNPIPTPLNAHLHAHADTVPEGPGKRLEVPGGASRNGPPRALSGHAQHPVIMEEAEQRQRWELPHPPRGDAPHRARHGQELGIQ